MFYKIYKLGPNFTLKWAKSWNGLFFFVWAKQFNLSYFVDHKPHSLLCTVFLEITKFYVHKGTLVPCRQSELNALVHGGRDLGLEGP